LPRTSGISSFTLAVVCESFGFIVCSHSLKKGGLFPPYEKQAAICRPVRSRIALHPVTLFETVDPAARIDEFLLAGIKRVALRADFNPQFLSYRTGGECLSARAPHGAFAILRVNFLLQWFHLLPNPCNRNGYYINSGFQKQV
jgi:hypothetical protein